MRATRLQLGLGGVCLLLVALIVAAWTVPLPDWQPPAERAATVTSVPENADAFVPPPETSFAAIDDRPVFNPERTPIAAASDTDAGGAGAIGDLTLVGVIIDGASRYAVLRAPGQPLATAVALGQTIDGWQVAEIDADHIVVRGQGTEQELRMTQHPPPPPSPAPQ